MTIAAATLFAVNGAVSKLALDGERHRHAALDRAALDRRLRRPRGRARLLAPRRLRIETRRELGRLAFYGIVGFALVQWLYFVAIDRLPIGIGLLFEFTAPVLIALWARFAWHEPVRRRVWPALGLVLGGLGARRADLGTGSRSTASASLAGLLAAVALAVYYLMGERLVGRRDPISVVCFGLGFASLAWAIVLPWWSFPTEALRIDGRAAARALHRARRRARALGDRARDDRAVLALDRGAASTCRRRPSGSWPRSSPSPRP